MTPDWEAIRAEFPALSNWTFLNSATFGQLPRRAIEAVGRHWAHRDELACSDFLDWYDDADRLRAAIARLIHASAEDVAFVSNAAAGLGIVMAGRSGSVTAGAGTQGSGRVGGRATRLSAGVAAFLQQRGRPGSAGTGVGSNLKKL